MVKMAVVLEMELKSAREDFNSGKMVNEMNVRESSYDCISLNEPTDTKRGKDITHHCSLEQYTALACPCT